jgi:hypothetical protein
VSGIYVALLLLHMQLATLVASDMKTFGLHSGTSSSSILFSFDIEPFFLGISDLAPAHLFVPVWQN